MNDNYFMRPITLYIAASIDNFIARTDGNVDWLESPEFHLPNEDFAYREFYDSIDCTLMGNNTYKAVIDFDIPFPYSDKTNFVFSQKTPAHGNEHVTFVSDDILEFVRKLKTKSGKGIWLIGGGQINSLLLENNLIDKIILTIVPITLGEGIPLFHGQAKT